LTSRRFLYRTAFFGKKGCLQGYFFPLRLLSLAYPGFWGKGNYFALFLHIRCLFTRLKNRFIDKKRRKYNENTRTEKINA
jgi:hypothetical protein